MTVLKDFIDLYYPTVFMAAARLTGSSDKEELALLTENVLVALYEHRLEFEAEARPGIYLYRLLLQETFSFLKQRGNEERIRILRDILLIDPALYLSDPPPEDV
jgi:DNA-directed RNA polymerase specialized sigma24 family protein